MDLMPGARLLDRAVGSHWPRHALSRGAGAPSLRHHPGTATGRFRAGIDALALTKRRETHPVNLRESRPPPSPGGF